MKQDGRVFCDGCDSEIYPGEHYFEVLLDGKEYHLHDRDMCKIDFVEYNGFLEQVLEEGEPFRY